MALIFVVDETTSTEELDDPEHYWGCSFDRTVDVRSEPMASLYDVVFPANELTDPPHLRQGIRAALLCGALGAVRHLAGAKLTCDVLFQPNGLARLDRYRERRRTLITARWLDTGTVLRDGDLEEVSGGAGMAASLKSAVLGRAVLYDLAKGTAIDFGMIGAREGETE